MFSRALVQRNLKNQPWCSRAQLFGAKRATLPFGRFYSQKTGSKTALVVGSSGVLGDTVSRYLGRDLGMKVIGADIVEIPSDFNTTDWELDGFIGLPRMAERPSIAEVTTELALGLTDILGEEEELDVIVCASGGWGGDPKPITDKSMTTEEIRKGAQEYGEAVDTMIYMNLIPVIAAGYSAQQFLGQNGLYVVIGATAALTSTPGMLGYGLSKAASHHVVQTMGANTGKSLETRAKRKEGRRFRQFASQLDSMSVVSILPTTIDTPNNRQAMPDADTDTWTKPRDIAEEIGKWVETPQLRPHSGALVKVASTARGSIFDLVR